MPWLVEYRSVTALDWGWAVHSERPEIDEQRQRLRLMASLGPQVRRVRYVPPDEAGLPIGQLALIHAFRAGYREDDPTDPRRGEWDAPDAPRRPPAAPAAGGGAGDEVPGVTVAEAVDHPPHYTAHPAGVECIDVVKDWGFRLGNAAKYIWRAGLKGDRGEDLAKALWYVRHEMARLERVACMEGLDGFRFHPPRAADPARQSVLGAAQARAICEPFGPDLGEALLMISIAAGHHQALWPREAAVAALVRALGAEGVTG